MTMIQRYCGVMAHTFAWSSPRNGCWILPFILVAYFLSLAALSHSRNLMSAWETLGVAADPLPFIDTRFITATVDCHRLGYDTHIENPCDPNKRLMSYPRSWLALASSGLTQDHTLIVGIGLAAIFFGSLLCWAGWLNPAQSLTFGIFLCSPHVMWIVERGNMDQVIFILLASSLALARWYPKTRPVLYVSIVISSILKLYPLASILVVGRNIPRRALAWGLIILIAFSAYIFFTWPDLIRVIRLATYRSPYEPKPFNTSFWWSYGRISIFEFIANKLHAKVGVEIPHSYLVFSSLMAVGIASIIALLWARKSHEILQDTDHLDSFLIGSSIYIGTFLIGNSYDYKLIFLILLLPQLFDWLQDRGELVCPAYLLLASLILSVWGESCFTWIHHRVAWNSPASGVLLQELANWFLFILLAKFKFLIIRSWVRSFFIYCT
jgi:hypothetical protein